jgi:hypothetical protein
VILHSRKNCWLNLAHVGQPLAWQAPEVRRWGEPVSKVTRILLSKHLEVTLSPVPTTPQQVVTTVTFSWDFCSRGPLRDTVCIIVGIFYVLPPQSLIILPTCSCRADVSHHHNYRLSRVSSIHSLVYKHFTDFSCSSVRIASRRHP